MNYKKTWFGWLNFCIGTIFMGVFLFASLVSMFEYIGITTSLFDIPWIRVSFIVSFAVILGILGIVILWHFLKKRIPLSDSFFSNSVSDNIVKLAFVAILVAGIVLRFNIIPDNNVDIISTKYLDKIMVLFNRGSLGDVDAITYVYCHIGVFFFRVFGVDNFCLFYLNAFFQMFAFIFLFYSIRITFGKTVAIFSYIGMFLTSLPLSFVNRITPDSLILFVVSIVILTISLFMNDLANGLVKSNSNFAIFIVLTLVQGGLILINPAFIVIPIYFSVRSLLMVRKDCNDNLVNSRFVTTFIFMGGSNLVVIITLIIKALIINDFGLVFSNYAANIGWSSLIRFFIYPSEYLITCIICFAFAFIGFVYYIFSDNDYISAITLLFALLYIIFAKNMIAYDLSFYFVILLALLMGFGVKRMFFEGYGEYYNEIEDEDNKEIKENYMDKDIKVSNDSIIEKEPQVDKKDKIKFIDNVLPLPKPHVKKTLDFAFEPSSSEMKYDYDISEDDDFDLP